MLRGTVLVSAVLAAILIAVELFGGNSLIQVATTAVIYVVLATGVQSFMGTSGIASFGHLAFAAIGGYVAALVSTPVALKETLIPEAPAFLIDIHAGFLVSTLAAAGVAALAAAVIGWAFARLSTETMPLATLGLLVVVVVVAKNWNQVTNGQETFYAVPVSVTLWVAFGVAVVAMAAARLFRDSRVGLALRATGDDELAASASSVDVVRARYLAWIFSGAVVGVGGSLYVHSLGVAAPTFFYFDLTFAILTIVIIGGSSVSGVLAGAFVFTTVTEVLRRLVTTVGDANDNLFALVPIGPALIVIALLALRPKGLFGRWELDELLARAVARRRASPSGASSLETTRIQR